MSSENNDLGFLSFPDDVAPAGNANNTSNYKNRGNNKDKRSSYGGDPGSCKSVLEYDEVPWFRVNFAEKNGNHLLSSNNTHENTQSKDTSPFISPFISLHNEIVSLATFLQPTTKEKFDRQQVVEDVKAIVHKIWPQATLHVFGSTMTNLITPNSDIDITILNIPDVNSNTIELLESLYQGVLAANVAIYAEVISNAKFPIVKFDHLKSGISVDLCVNNSSGLDTGKIMKRYLREYPPLRPLALVIKLFLSQRKLHETYTGGIGSFVLCNMIVSFLQNRQRLANHLNTELSSNLGVLLIDFFRLYGVHYNYAKTGISVGNSCYYSKQSFGSEFFNLSKPMALSVENPDPQVHPSVDIGKNSYMIIKIKKLFEHAYTVLNSIISKPPKLEMASYLSFIVRCDDPTLISRIQDAVDDKNDFEGIQDGEGDNINDEESGESESQEENSPQEQQEAGQEVEEGEDGEEKDQQQSKRPKQLRKPKKKTNVFKNNNEPRDYLANKIGSSKRNRDTNNNGGRNSNQRVNNESNSRPQKRIRKI